MRFALSTTVQAHTFDVAKVLQRRSMLAGLMTGMPQNRLSQKGLKGHEIRSFPFPVVMAMAANRIVRTPGFALRHEAAPKVALDRWVARNLVDGDVFIATSSVGLASGREAKRRGMLWVCDRPCSHILTQDRLLREEHELQGSRWPGISRAIIERELAEYEEADAILVPSRFAEQSFLEHGVAPRKIWRIPYGVDLSSFRPNGMPDEAKFQVLFAGTKSLQKGIPYLLEAFEALDCPRKELVLVGTSQPETAHLLKRLGRQVEDRHAVPQTELAHLMSTSHVLVLPSIQDGFGMVMAQAMACGCPVVATTNTGAQDLLRDGVEGFVVPIRNPAAIASRIQMLADDPELRQRMGSSAREAVERLSGWESYVDRLCDFCRSAR